MQPDDRTTEPRVYTAAGVGDAAGLRCEPGAVAMAGGRVVAAGDVERVRRAAGLGARRIELRNRLLIPSLVNGHVHLDLTELPGRSFCGSFTEWAKSVMRDRPAEPEAVRAAVRRGVELSMAAGVGTVGDIAGSAAAGEALAGSALRGVSFAELVGITGSTLETSLERAAEVAGAPLAGRVRGGLQPHAPYSTGPELYRAADRSGLPVCTHLAETREELQFVAEAAGPFRELLEELGKWDERVSERYGGGRHPLDWLLEALDEPRARWLLAHGNYLGDEQIERLAELGWSLAYCPRASEYFGHEGHRYREMLEAGVNVCLGTDSRVCSGTMSIFDEMRRLYQRDGTDADTLLAMGTVNGNRALGLPAAEATFAEGASPGLAAVECGARAADPLADALAARDAPAVELLELPGDFAPGEITRG